VKNRTVSICCFQEQLPEHSDDAALVAIDVIRATTTAITAISTGRRCFFSPTIEAAFDTASRLPSPLLAGEVGGDTPAGFEMTNSPAQLSARMDIGRPLVLLSSSGTRLMHQISYSESAYIACFRNYSATADYLAQNHHAVVLIGAGTRGEFREEDQMCCAWIANRLMDSGFVSEDEATRQLIERWRGTSQNAFLMSRSVDYLRKTGQLRDLKFILSHFDDIDTVYKLTADEIRSIAVAAEI
jgi:2-phosphosulfolactate phosphatase